LPKEISELFLGSETKVKPIPEIDFIQDKKYQTERIRKGEIFHGNYKHKERRTKVSTAVFQLRSKETLP